MSNKYAHKQLEEIAFTIRKDVICMLSEARSGHLGGSLGLADIFASLYFRILHHRPEEPDWSERDRFVLSIGHVAPVYYATLARAGYFPPDELKTLRKLGTRLQGHPGRDHRLPGLELSAGSLGQGLSVAVGMALAAKIDGRSEKTYCLLGDGELQEGSVWEAAMSAAHHHLNNLIAIVDRNGVQIDGPTEEVMQLEPLEDKWKSFGWKTICCNGNSIPELIEAFENANQSEKKPTVIIAQTQMGRGVASIENDYHWHGKAPSADEAQVFLKELNTFDS